MSPLRVAVLLSGCGFKDGSEIHEAVAALYHLASAGAAYDCFAPDRDFAEVDHLTGEATNLSAFAMKGADSTALPEVSAAVSAFHAAGKPIAVICIAPAMLAAAPKGSGIHAKLTVGGKSGACDGVKALGARHDVCPVDGFVVDEENKIVSTPAYLYDGPITGPFTGIGKLVAALLADAGYCSEKRTPDSGAARVERGGGAN